MDKEPGSDKLFGAIDQRAEEERRTIRAEAEARCRQILGQADARVEALKAEAMQALEKELAGHRQRLRGEARMKARGEALQVKRRLLAQAFERAGAEIALLRGSPAAAEVFRSLSAEAAAAVGEPCTVEASAEDGTVVATSPDGSRGADNGLVSRLRRAQMVDEPEVARRLFGKRSP
jgi:vacuolar-type H+-ATPase subunit E/Vma4